MQVNNRRLYLFRLFALIFHFLISEASRESDAVSNDCNITDYIARLHGKWTSNSWPEETSSRCIGHIMLQWAYQLRGALDGETTLEKNVYLDSDSSNFETKCDPSLNRRINRSSLDALNDLFNLFFELSKLLKEEYIDWCWLTAIGCHKTFYNQTLVLVRKMNCLVRQQNRFYSTNLIDYRLNATLCEK